ncbi:MAG: hypothetical protein ACT4O1_08130 [Gemmatimonadota bacterium]
MRPDRARQVPPSPDILLEDPGVVEDVTEAEHQEAVAVAEAVLSFAQQQIESRD